MSAPDTAAESWHDDGPLLPVSVLPDPVLSRLTSQVDPADPAVLALARRLVTLMRASPACVGVAAPQVGVSARLFVLDVTGHPKAKTQAGLVVLANPFVVAAEGVKVAREGCLSVPDLTGDVPRARTVTVRGMVPGPQPRERTVTANAFEARAFQHELDHLDGLLFLDRVRDPAGLHARRTYQ
ncbi:MAG: formylmethionine deformylase [Mycobacterium sp.]|nr:formylmethionine deformylase [Mycobacterium sp.]